MHPVDMNGLVVLGLEGLAAVLAEVLAALDVSRLDVVGDGLEAGARLVADGAVRLVGDAVHLDELPDFGAVVGVVEVAGLAFVDENFCLLFVAVAAVKFYKEFQNVFLFRPSQF